MYKKAYKGRCKKRYVAKCEGVCRTFNDIQEKYADRLSKDEDIQSFRCNVLMEGLEDGDYTTDIVATKTDGTLIVRECVCRRHLMKPKTCRLLEQSRQYWQRRGVIGADWGMSR